LFAHQTHLNNTNLLLPRSDQIHSNPSSSSLNHPFLSLSNSLFHQFTVQFHRFRFHSHNPRRLGFRWKSHRNARDRDQLLVNLISWSAWIVCFLRELFGILVTSAGILRLCCNSLASCFWMVGSVFTVSAKFYFSFKFCWCSAWVQEIIGKCSYGVVCSAIDIHIGEKVAIKKINDVFEHVSDATRILGEIKLLRLLRHPDLHQVIKANDDLTPEHHQFC
jgi:hypothetical protein